MFIAIVIAFCLLSYLLGSAPNAVWVGKAFYEIDVRMHGSGNAGATNTFRVLGKPAGILVLLLDALKGASAANLVMFLGIHQSETQYTNLQLLFGLCAVMGHIFPLFAGFKGGKGIATLFGMVIAIHLPLALVSAGVFATVLLATRYVSLSSITAAIAFPLLAVFIFREHSKYMIIFGITSAILVVLTHQKNIRKLVQGTENKAKIFKKNRV